MIKENIIKLTWLYLIKGHTFTASSHEIFFLLIFASRTIAAFRQSDYWLYTLTR